MPTIAPGLVQEYLATAAHKAATDLIEAFLRLPDNKRDWKPAPTDEMPNAGNARTALSHFTECTLLNLYSADLIRTHVFGDHLMAPYEADNAELLTLDTEALCARLLDNTQIVMAAIRDVPDADLTVPIVTPWQTQPLGETIAYPYWNMTYHLGQINYLASLLGCLE